MKSLTTLWHIATMSQLTHGFRKPPFWSSMLLCPLYFLLIHLSFASSLVIYFLPSPPLTSPPPLPFPSLSSSPPLLLPSPHSQLQCVHFSSWDNNKDWTITLPSKESIQTVTIGDGWVAMATNKQLLRLLTVGGVQREVISLPGTPVTLAGWGGRLAVVYQMAPCESSLTLFSYSVHVNLLCMN